MGTEQPSERQEYGIARSIGNIVAGAIERLVRWVVLPVTSAIPMLVSSGLLLAGFAALWLGFGAALVARPSALDDAWRSLWQLPMPVQGIAWLLFMPVLVGLWLWETDWPVVIRLALLAGVAGWNLLVFVPRHGPAHEARVGAATQR